MKKIYSFILVAILSMMGLSANAQEKVTVNDLRGTWIFRGVASDWYKMGQVLPTIHTFTFSVDEETNKVTATTTIGDVWGFGDAEDGSEDYKDALHGTYDPETQVLTFTDTYDETTGLYTYVMDEYYAFYTYDLAFRADRDDAGNVVLQMVPTANNSMLVLAYGDYDAEGNYTWYYYGYDLGATVTAPANGELQAGQYELSYTNAEGTAATMPCEVVATEDGGLALAINNAQVALTPQSVGFGGNKKTYAYVAKAAYTIYGEGEYDYYYNFCSSYYGYYDVTFYANGDGTFSANVGIALGSIDDETVLSNVVLQAPGTGIKTVANKQSTGAIYNLRGQRVAAPQKGLYIRDGKKLLVK